MKLENIKVCARLRESPAALFKVNKLTLSEDEKSITLSSLNDLNRENTKQGNFDNCFGKFSHYSDVTKGMDCPKYLKQLLHGYNSSILSFGVGESDAPGSRCQFLLENLDNLQRIMDQNAYRYNYSMSFAIFGVSDGHCVNLMNYKKCNSLEIEAFLQDYEQMESIENFEEIKRILSKGYSLPVLVFLRLRTESRNEVEKSAANVSILCLGDLGGLSNPSMEKSFGNMKNLVLTLDQTFVSGELRVRESPLTHLLSPFLGGNSHTLVLMEILTNSSFTAVSDAFLFAEALRKVKNRIEQVFENYLVEEVDELWEQNSQLSREKLAIEKELDELNSSFSRLQSDQNLIKGERDLLSCENESQRFLLDYNLARMEVQKLEVKDKIRALRFEILQLDHQRALMNTQAFNESIGRRQAEFELSRALRIARETENSFGGQIGVLRERILQTSDELQRSLEDRSIIQSKLQNAQHQIMQLSGQLRDAEDSKAALERQKTFDSRNERIKAEMESEIRQLKRQLEMAQESERNLQENTRRSDQTRRELIELERELRVLKTENSLLQSKLEAANVTSVKSVSTNGTKSTRAPVTKISSSPAIIPNIPVIKVPAVPAVTKQAQTIPLEIADESPIVRRGKRHSNIKASETTSNEITDNIDINATAPSVVSVPVAEPTKSPVKKIKVTENDSNGLNSLLEGIGKKKIKLPERSRGNSAISAAAALSALAAVPSTPQAGEIPRSTPMGKSVDPSVMESIMSSFTVKIPTIKK